MFSKSNFIGEVRLYTDGGCRGNPGPGAIGVLILDASNQVIEEYKSCIGETTNNRAEYQALIKGLDLCAKHTRGTVHCFLDSELVVKQLHGGYRLKNEDLRALFFKVKEREQLFKEVIYQHVRREHKFIKEADRMVNEAFDGR
jgi:ribonuclease HI